MSEKRVRLNEVAEACGVSVSTVSGWKTAKWQPKGEAVERLARFFGVSVSFLLYGKPQENRENFNRVQESQASFRRHQSSGIIKQKPLPYPTIAKSPTRDDVLRIVHRYLDDAEAFGPGGIAAAYHKIRLACDPKDFDYDPANFE